MHDNLNSTNGIARDPTNNEHSPCCININRECLEKTLLVEQYLLPLLQHHNIPGGIINEFKRRWRYASLLGKDLTALLHIIEKAQLPITVDMTDEELRTSILESETM